MGFKIGFCGAGQFASRFIPLFQAHPDVDEVVLSDLFPDLLQRRAKEFGIARVFPSHEALCASDVDAICIFSQRWMHGPQAIQALQAGKHVYSAVPMGVTFEELEEIASLARQTGLIYMLGETDYYRPQTIYCRERYARGDFGRFVYGEGQYYHDMSDFYSAFQRSGGEDWKRLADFPPMLYPTHSVSHILSVTFARMTEAFCLGFEDDHEDGVFRREISDWGNPWSNQSALFRTADGGMARINEFRRIGAGESRMSIMGTIGAYEEQTAQAVWTTLGAGKGNHEDVSWVRAVDGVEITEANLGGLPRECLGKTHAGVSRVAPVERLPREFVGLENLHEGSHQFLVIDFLESCLSGKLPPNHAWMAARYNAPGIAAWQSCQRGEAVKIPDFGLPPVNASFLDPRYPMKP